MSDVVRVSILLASHAPVNDVIAGAVLIRNQAVVGNTDLAELPSTRIAAGMFVQLFSKGNLAAQAVVSDLDSTSVTATITNVAQPGAYLEANDVAHFTSQPPQATAFRAFTSILARGSIETIGTFAAAGCALVDAGARARVEFALSEALRLVTLPGEEQGRVYYFRRVNVKDVPADGNRAVWLDKMQSALSDVAQRAMHGNDRRAIASDVIFFHSHAEALELLLRRIVKRESFAEWFWPLVTRCETDASRGEQIAAIVERLRELPAAWGRVGQVLFAQRGGAGPIAVAADLPLASVARWLRELGATGVNETLAQASRCRWMSRVSWRVLFSDSGAKTCARYG